MLEFLRARLDDDEQLAVAAGHGQWEVSGPPGGRSDLIVGESMGGFRKHLLEPTMHADRPLLDHVVSWSPSRVLAEVAAKRAIIAEHTDPDGHECPGGAWIKDGDVCTTVRLLAQPYADHPDYRQEWKP